MKNIPFIILILFLTSCDKILNEEDFKTVSDYKIFTKRLCTWPVVNNDNFIFVAGEGTDVGIYSINKNGEMNQISDISSIYKSPVLIDSVFSLDFVPAETKDSYYLSYEFAKNYTIFVKCARISTNGNILWEKDFEIKKITVNNETTQAEFLNFFTDKDGGCTLVSLLHYYNETQEFIKKLVFTKINKDGFLEEEFVTPLVLNSSPNVIERIDENNYYSLSLLYGIDLESALSPEISFLDNKGNVLNTITIKHSAKRLVHVIIAESKIYYFGANVNDFEKGEIIFGIANMDGTVIQETIIPKFFIPLTLSGSEKGFLVAGGTMNDIFSVNFFEPSQPVFNFYTTIRNPEFAWFEINFEGKIVNQSVTESTSPGGGKSAICLSAFTDSDGNKVFLGIKRIFNSTNSIFYQKQK